MASDKKPIHLYVDYDTGKMISKNAYDSPRSPTGKGRTYKTIRLFRNGRAVFMHYRREGNKNILITKADLDRKYARREAENRARRRRGSARRARRK